MANFTTHIAVGTIVSGALATLTLAANVIPNESLVEVTLAGVIGSVLPDIDLKESRPSRAMFAGLAIFFSFAVLFTCAGRYSIVELWMLWLGTLLGVRYGLHALFHRISVHRGIWHSLLALVFCSLLTVLGFKYILGEADGIDWLAGGFLGIGFFTHLLLDEIYSVDVMDTRLKASFGTAIKLADFHRGSDTIAMAICTVGLLMIAPPVKQFTDAMSSQSMWSGLQSHLLPQDSWFGVIEIKRHVAESTPTGAGPTPPIAQAQTQTQAPAPAQAQPQVPQQPLTTGAIPARTPFRTIAGDGPTPGIAK